VTDRSHFFRTGNDVFDSGLAGSTSAYVEDKKALAGKANGIDLSTSEVDRR